LSFTPNIEIQKQNIRELPNVKGRQSGKRTSGPGARELESARDDKLASK